MKAILPVFSLFLAATCLAVDLPSQTDISLLKEVARTQDHGVDWLVKQQEKDGSWRHHPAITGLAVTALARTGKPLTPEQQMAVDHGVKFILTCVKPSGAIFGGGELDKYPNYSTAICSMALVAARKPETWPAVLDARKFLLSSQLDEEHGIASTNANYGGVGYGRSGRPDMSNMQWALEAIHITESIEKTQDTATKQNWDLHWQKAVQFLQRCQNLPSHNDQAYAKNASDRDLGGFIYMPGMSFADEGEVTDPNTPLRSYGSMSYAGLKSYIYADLKKNDPRVVAAVNWLKHNYTLDENPGMGAQGLYYYYQTFAKALTAYGDDTFTDANGKVRDWRYELMNKLVDLQKADGFWQNDNGRWWENDPVLVTTYSLITLETLQQRHYP